MAPMKGEVRRPEKYPPAMVARMGWANAIDDGGEGEKPDGKESGAEAAVEAEGGEDPDGEPGEVKDDEKI